jgi:hypothetical protein
MRTEQEIKNKIATEKEGLEQYHGFLGDYCRGWIAALEWVLSEMDPKPACSTCGKGK